MIATVMPFSKIFGTVGALSCSIVKAFVALESAGAFRLLHGSTADMNARFECGKYQITS